MHRTPKHERPNIKNIHHESVLGFDGITDSEHAAQIQNPDESSFLELDKTKNEIATIKAQMLRHMRHFAGNVIGPTFDAVRRHWLFSPSYALRRPE